MRAVVLLAAGLIAFTPAAAQDSPVPHEAVAATNFINSIGVNTHLSYFDTTYGSFGLIQTRLLSIGIRHLRDGAHLQDDAYNRLLYGRWRNLAASGIRFDAVIDPRSGLGPISAATLSKIEMLAGGSIESFEGANEMDISKAADWISVDRSHQQALFAAVKAAQNGGPTAVIGPSLAFASAGRNLGNLCSAIDYGNLHPYPAGKLPSVVFPEQTQLARDVCPNKPVVITETGYHNAQNDHRDQPSVSEAAAAKYIPRLFLEDFAHGIVRTYLYEFADERSEPALADEQAHWGLVRSDGSEKPAYVALKNLIDELNDVKEPPMLHSLAYALNGGDAHTHQLLLEKSSGEFALVLWQEIPSYDLQRQKDIANAPLPVSLVLSQRAKRITVYRPSKQGTALARYANAKSLDLEIPDEPLVIDIQMR